MSESVTTVEIEVSAQGPPIMFLHLLLPLILILTKTYKECPTSREQSKSR